ncbi:hypothetical protein [Peribacillus sp. FSL P2-0133]|uniref:hypothetical protein n=1 Tax=Peribacillus sp. FSL P2-0133 TaxID=2921573 RepID=UPI0030D2B223
MNFDTKYLIRWGIPGWIMVMALLPYYIIIYFDFFSDHVVNSSDLLAIGAVLTVLGVPLGYLLNQIHHSVFWVLPKLIFGSWSKYFNEELKVDDYIANHKNGAEKKERYRYLLTRKHELGGFMVSLFISAFVIGLSNVIGRHHHHWTWWYFAIVTFLFLIILLSRQYSSRNIEVYHDHYLKGKD